MAATDYTKALALRDNPFSPTIAIEGVERRYMDSLVTQPLQVHRAPLLDKLYCPQAGPFQTHVNHFLTEIARKGYRKGAPRGFRSMIFLVKGPVGSGKSTLASVMLNELQQCKTPAERAWKIYTPWITKIFLSPPDQVNALVDLQKGISEETGSDDYICVALDSLMDDALYRTLDLYQELRDSGRVIFLFILSGDQKILMKDQSNFRYDIEVFKTSHLSAANALAYVQHRLQYYRAKESTTPCLQACPLYPFSEKNIVEVLGPQQTGSNNGGAGPANGAAENGYSNNVTIRQFNRVLDDAIGIYMDELQDAFDVSNVKRGQADEYLIDLENSYRRTVANE